MSDSDHLTISFQQLLFIRDSHVPIMLPIDRIYREDGSILSEDDIEEFRKVLIRFVKKYFSSKLDPNMPIYMEKCGFRIIKSKHVSKVLGKNKDDVKLVPNVLFQKWNVDKYVSLLILLSG
jgi:hypothetical protein